MTIPTEALRCQIETGIKDMQHRMTSIGPAHPLYADQQRELEVYKLALSSFAHLDRINELEGQVLALRGIVEGRCITLMHNPVWPKPYTCQLCGENGETAETIQHGKTCAFTSTAPLASQLVAKIEAEALERAAKVCDGLPIDPSGPSFNDDYNVGCYDCASRIRALIKQPPSEVPSGYWDALNKRIEKAPRLPEEQDSTPDPEAL